MSIAYPPASVPYAKYTAEQQARTRAEQERDQERARRIKAEQERDQERQAHTHTKQLYNKLRQDLHQERQTKQQRKLFMKSNFKPAEKLVIEEIQRQLDDPNRKRDEQGYTQICYETAALNIGMSNKTPKRSLEAVLEQAPDFPIETKTVEERQEDGKVIPRLYLKAHRNLFQAGATTTLTQQRKQGGNQYQCQKCLSHHVMIKRQLVCLDCGHETDLEPTYPNGKLKQNRSESGRTNLVLSDPPANTAQSSQVSNNQGHNHENSKKSESGRTNLVFRNNEPVTRSISNTPTENFLSHDSQVVDVVIKPVTPPNADKLAEIEALSESESDTGQIAEAAVLLLVIAGDDQKHIEMSRTGEKKYYQVNRPLHLSDLVEHLRGGQARGSLCRYRDGRTRALCFDADDPETWDILKRAARQLAQAEYRPILEESPAERGGHLWIIYTDLVNAAAARTAVLQFAPELGEIPEYWPGPAEAVTWNRVRLPGAFYARYGRSVEQKVLAWCTLSNASTGESSSDGASAARLLLASLTPAALVSVIRSQNDQAPTDTQSERPSACQVAQQPEAPTTGGRAGALPNTDGQGVRLPEVDAYWVQRYGPIETTTCYFAVMPNCAAACYNREHSLEEIRPRERNGMALSPNGQERTASTNYRDTAQGERWTDFSTHGRRADGTHESGDAFELASKVQEMPNAESSDLFGHE